MEFPQTERQAELMATADRLAAGFAAGAEQHDRENSFPFENFEALREAGFLALTVPEEYGGRGIDPLELALVNERLARGDGSTALATNMHLSLLGRLGETRPWPEKIFARVCRDVVEHGALINSAHSEPELGSPSRGGLPSSTAERTAGGWRVHGHKRWASLAPVLRYVTVLATITGEDGEPQRANFLVRTDSPGLRVEETWDNLGMRGTGSHDLLLENVEVPDDALLTEEPAREVPGGGRGWGAFGGSAVYLGIAGAARDAAIAYARERRPNSMAGPIAELPTTQHRVAEIELLLLQARTVFYDTAQTWVACPDQRPDIEWRLAAVKHLATNHAIAITDLALRVVGSVGLSRSMPIQRYFRDVRTGLGQPPMDDVAMTIIGRAALGV
jgi:alkylation response protein AidB-like acyl-CoA dehydrogenase